jgi:hypothetical protein
MKMGRTVLRTRRARIWPGHNRSEALARVSWPLGRCGDPTLLMGDVS